MASKKKKTAAARSSTKKAPASKKAAAAPAPAPATAEALVVASKVKAAIKEAGCNTGGDALEALNQYAHWLLKQAVARAAANGRKTVRAHDFMLQG